MTIKEQLHQIIDELDDERAEAALVVLVRLSNESATAPEPRRVRVAQDINTPEELEAIARPTSADDPLWDIVGIIKDGPPDFAENHDKYLAEAYADLHDEEYGDDGDDGIMFVELGDGIIDIADGPDIFSSRRRRRTGPEA